MHIFAPHPAIAHCCIPPTRFALLSQRRSHTRHPNPCYSAALMTEALENLLASAEQARREKRLPDARRDALAAVALAEQADDSAATARAITLWARSERDLGDQEVALRAYKKAATIYRDRRDALHLAHTLRHLGDIHQDAKRAAEAEPLFREALEIYRAHPAAPALDLANALRPLALLQHDAGNCDEADQLWEEAKNLYAQVNVLPGVAEWCRPPRADRSPARKSRTRPPNARRSQHRRPGFRRLQCPTLCQ